MARKPVVIHAREAWDDTLRLLREHHRPPASSTASSAVRKKPGKSWAGLLPQLAGVVTFPKAERLREAARMAPSTACLSRPDAPTWPVPHPGTNRALLCRRDRPPFGRCSACESLELARRRHHRQLPAAVRPGL